MQLHSILSTVSKTRILSNILFKVIEISEFYWACVYKVTTVFRNNLLAYMLPSIYVSLTLMEAEISKITVLIVQVLGHHGKRLIF